MTVIKGVSFNLKSENILRRIGLGKHVRIEPRIESIIRELMDCVESSYLLESAIVYEFYPITKVHQKQVTLEGNFIIKSSLLPSLFNRAKYLVVAVCTIGPSLEKQVTDYTHQGEPLRGLLLDGIGSAAVDALAQDACKRIADKAASIGYQASGPINPGMPGLPIKEQRQLLKMVSAREIGVSLTSSGIMVPLKSTSMVMGIGPKMNTWTQAEVCAKCNLGRACPYKISFDRKAE